MKKAIIILAVFLVGCGGVTTEWLSPLFMPFISKSVKNTSPKKGVSLGIASCQALEGLGISWYYSGKACEGYERILYLDKPHLLAEAITEPPPDAKYVMFINECDNPYWGCPSIKELVTAYIALEKAWPGIIWVGPCIAKDPLYVRAFWTEYTQRTGHRPDPATHRLCVHCYNSATTCIKRVEDTLDAVVGLDEIWVTEFGFVPGWDFTYRQARDENDKFVDWMESDDRVERYAYWSSKFHYGVTVPAKPGTGWIPLRFDWRNADGTFSEVNTGMGDWYAGVGE